MKNPQSARKLSRLQKEPDPQARRLVKLMAETKDEFITIVSGLPRSGTSMMMQMLDSGGLPALTDNIRKADEDNLRGYFEFEPVKRTKKDASWLDSARGKVVKMVHLLLRDLPLDRKYRIIIMRRSLDEVVRSQNVMLDRQGKKGGNLSDEKVKEIFELQLRQVDKYLQDHPNFEVLHVNYNEMIADPGPAVRAVNEFLGGFLDTEAMTNVVEPSLYRQRHGK